MILKARAAEWLVRRSGAMRSRYFVIAAEVPELLTTGGEILSG